MKTIYWISTIATCAFLIFSSYTYLFNKATIDKVKALGFPDFFRVQLALLKIAAVTILLVPHLPNTLKEWAYAGVMLFFTTAFVAHIAHRDSVGILLILVVLSFKAMASYYTKSNIGN